MGAGHSNFQSKIREFFINKAIAPNILPAPILYCRKAINTKSVCAKKQRHAFPKDEKKRLQSPKSGPKPNFIISSGVLCFKMMIVFTTGSKLLLSNKNINKNFQSTRHQDECFLCAQSF